MWTESRLDQLAFISSGGTPSRDVDEFWGGDIPWVTPTDITACQTNYVVETADRITKKGLLSSAAKLLPPGTILLTSRATVGVSRIAGLALTTNQGFKNLIPQPHVDGTFLFYQVQRQRAVFERYAAGSTFPEINKKDTARVLIAHPLGKSTQQRIASVISCIDTAIEKIETLIAKHQQIKAGLMHDLFTRGVLPNGQLRPPRSVAPELYQKTTLGWIPRDWTVAALNDKVNPARPIVYGILMPGYGHPGGVPVVKVKDIRDRSIDAANLLLTSPATDQEYRRSRLKGGDVLFTIRGTVGRVSLVPAALENANITQDTARIDLLGVSNTFISLFMESSAAKRFFEINTLGVAVQGINLGELRKLPIPVPSQDEQEEISARLFCCLEYIDNEVAKKHKLEAQKLGLMQDLLTGRVPVPVRAEPAETAA
ncbi:restriction endonuclease subunit S [uncultured Hydrogenophaga sp.]|uniref:restriction endonuclease subunit S n=1 Tax=uncultured Hydrogenophaga sp. TaxID=199683 RepID=UPI00265E7165|nr:restriction endonuclease subunit S [uncultured Hydrogenophaga sp.]